MTLSLLRSLTMALSMVSLFPHGLRLYIHPDWVNVSIGFFPGQLMKPPLVAESMASEWTSSIGLRSLQQWLKLRRDVIPDDLKQPPVVAESVTAEWTSSIGLRSPRGWVRVRMGVVPEGPKKQPAVAESVAAEWNSIIGLRSPNTWVRVRVRSDIVPEGLKQQPVVAESMASDLPYPLGQLWVYLAPVDVTSLLCRAWQTVWLLCVAWIALALWRTVERPQGQARGWTASASTRTDCWGKGTFCSYKLLCRLKATIARLRRCQRLLHRFCLKVLWHQLSKKKAEQEKAQKRTAFSSSPCNSG